MGYMVVTATLLVTFGRISDMFGRVKMYNLGFAIFTLGSLLLAFTPGSGDQAAMELLIFRLVQGVGGAFLFANSTALLTDAFPPEQRGMAMGINQIAGIVGSLGGLLLGGWLSTIDWRLVFLVSVPVRPVRHRLGLSQAARDRRRSAAGSSWISPATSPSASG